MRAAPTRSIGTRTEVTLNFSIDSYLYISVSHFDHHDHLPGGVRICAGFFAELDVIPSCLDRRQRLLLLCLLHRLVRNSFDVASHRIQVETQKFLSSRGGHGSKSKSINVRKSLRVEIAYPTETRDTRHETFNRRG